MTSPIAKTRQKPGLCSKPVRVKNRLSPLVLTYLKSLCSGQPIPDSGLSFSSATAGGNPSLN